MAGEGSLIATTRNASLQALGTGGQLAVQSWDQIIGYLRRNLGPAHAALLAEPNPDTAHGTTDWYAETLGEAPPLDSLPEPEREAARATLARLLEDIQAAAAALRQSARAGDRFMAELLSLALVVPGPEHVRVAGGQPVLVAWAHSPVNAPPAPELLIGMARRPAAASVGPMRILGPPPTPRRRHPAAPLLIPTLLLLLALLLLWFDPWRWVQAAPLQCVVRPGDTVLLDELHQAEAQEASLRQEIAQLTTGLGDRRVACPPLPAQAAVPAPAPPPNADAERARREGARSGRIQVILAWDDQNDIDLAVLCPGGQRISFENTRACGGELDVDRNAGSRGLTIQPVENVVFAREPVPGRYRIVVTHFEHNAPAPQTSPFRVTLRREGLPDQLFAGTVSPGRSVEVAGFDSPVR